MKVREVININRTLTLQELYEFMQQCWDKTTYNDFVLGRPWCVQRLHPASCD